MMATKARQVGRAGAFVLVTPAECRTTRVRSQQQAELEQPLAHGDMPSLCSFVQAPITRGIDSFERNADVVQELADSDRSALC
jgi:hypothetical protein